MAYKMKKMRMNKPHMKKMTIGGHSHAMMSHKVRSEPARSSGGHSMHASFPLAHMANHGTRAHKSRATSTVRYPGAGPSLC